MKFDDIDEVYKLEHKLFPNPWPKIFFENDLQRSDTIALVACNNTKLVGYALANCAGPELHITNIAVRQEYQRQGIARNLMKEVENIGKNRGCVYAYLEVRINNEAAINLYKKVGYKILYIRKNYYIDGTDAYVMGKELKEV
ncbi:MAG: ribosomal protein S18-alanine N-acetyltransferase [candidate division WOR-3 bacterium]